MGSAAPPTALSDQLIPFGHAMLEHFPQDPKYKNLNHGSFGTFPRVVQKQQRKFQDDLESAPDVKIRFERSELVDESRKAVAQVLKAPVNEVVFVKNATSGVNTVLRNLDFSKGDVVVYFADIYVSCEKTIMSVQEKEPLEARRIAYSHPVTHDYLVQRFRDEVKKAKGEGLKVRVAIFDTIVSQPGVRFPFERLVEACREEGVLSLIDAAHGIGHIPLDLGTLQPDFFVSNCHKWLFTPRGCAVFYVPKRNQHLIRTTFPTSHGFQPDASFDNLFDRVATDDDTSYYCVPAALEFRKTRCGGEDAIMSYCETLAHKVGNRVADILGTEVLSETGVDREVQGASQLRRCALANVRLPISIIDGDSTGAASRYPVSIKATDVDAVRFWIEKEQAAQNTIVPVFRHGDGLWVRLSAQIYLELSDFEWLAEMLKGIVERVGLGEASVDGLKV